MLFLREICDTSSVLKVIMFARELVKIIFILVPIGLIIMTSVDIAKNVISGKEDDMKKNANIAIKRVMMAIIVFFIPTIVSAVNGLVEESVNGNFLYNECLDNANSDYIKDMENEEITEKELEKLNRQKTNTPDITRSNTTTGSNATTGSLRSMTLPSDDRYYPLDGKDSNGNKFNYLEFNGSYLTENEMNQINNFVLSSINQSNDWGERVATAGWALAYSLSEKGLIMHYQKHGWGDSSDGTGSSCKKEDGFCNFWGQYITTSSTTIGKWCNAYGGYINYSSPRDCTSSQISAGKYYSGVDCTGLVKWAIRTACGTADISDSKYQGDRNLFPRTSDISKARAGDVLITTSHVKLFLKNNGDGTYMTVESSSGGAAGVFFKKSTANDLKNYQVIQMSNGYAKYCKK